MEKIWLKSYPPGVPAEIDPAAYASINEMAGRSFSSYADLTAFVQMGRELTYRELEERAAHSRAGCSTKRDCRRATVSP